MGRVVTFGEIMMRLNPSGYQRFLQTTSFEVSFAGGEANTAVSLARLGMDAAFVTKLPDHEIGEMALCDLRRVGVDTRGIVRGPGRLGTFYIEKGASQRPSKVIYDRAASAIAQARREDFDWDRIFEGVHWFHFTGITPALGGELPQICLDACQAAKRHGVTVSCDLNYRKKLWSQEEAGRVMATLMPYVDVCISNEEDAKDVFGIVADNTDIDAGKLDQQSYVAVARKLQQRFGFRKVAITLRGSLSASDNDWAGLLYCDDDSSYLSKTYRIHIVDRVGGGDSFGGGLIYGLMAELPPQQTIDFAVAASCLKHTMEHDYNLVTVDEVMALANGNGSGRVQR